MLVGQAGWYDSIGHPPSGTGTVIASCPASINVAAHSIGKFWSILNFMLPD